MTALNARPTDGGFAISHRSGKILAAAAKFLSPSGPFSMPNHGTRHMAAVDLAEILNSGVVFVRSERDYVTAFPAAPTLRGQAWRISSNEKETNLQVSLPAARDVTPEALQLNEAEQLVSSEMYF